jgi:valyl-tRNA synthetase
MDKRWKHQEFEENIYKNWEDNGYFTPEIDKDKQPFCIIMPPPNANGSLHIGHAKGVTIQDIMLRWHRMMGEPTLGLPGADHAGILTQVVFEKKLEEEGKSREVLGREEFNKQCLEFTLNNKEHMYNQIRDLGASCDWTRETFTLDEEVSNTVNKTLKTLYDDDLVYRDYRMISWCPRCQTALSDLEVEYEQKQTNLWYINYPFTNEDGQIPVATTRPETMLGDTAVAVNPDDKRYKDLIGKKLVLPLVNREIPIIADEIVDPEFGTGAVKVTPAHDPDDFQMGQNHDLDTIQVIGFNGKMTNQAGKEFEGLTTQQAREKVISQLKEKDLLEKTKKYEHRVGHCERCKTTVEPLISLQWFIKMDNMAQKGLQAVNQGEINIFPDHFEKVYSNWLENIQDWCISRQLWWGHRLPIWYCGHKGLSDLQKSMNPELVKEHEKGCGEIYVGQNPPEKCSNCEKSDWVRDPDTFDTWFSSGQWPFTTLGYPDSEDYQYFYPTSVMETGYDILFFWVARMIMLGLYRTDKKPFENVYLHGMVRDAFGEPMSKSRPETLIEPDETVEEYGADALRMALVYGTSAGNDVGVSEDKIRSMRNFSNKIWNAARFIMMNLEHAETKPKEFDPANLYSADEKIINQMNKTIEKVNTQMDKFMFGQALEDIYQFFWHEFCDVYLESTKDRRDEALPALIHVLITSLKLLHPYAPFVTEAIYQEFKQELPEHKILQPESLMIAPWPK